MRRLYNLAAVLSLVLGLTITAAIVVQWVRSGRGGEMIARNTIDTRTDRQTVINRRVWSTPGTLDLDWNEETTVLSGQTLVESVPRVLWVHRRYDGDRGRLARVGGDAPDWLVRLGLNWSGGGVAAPNFPREGARHRFVWVQARYSLLLAAAIAVNLLPAMAVWRIIRRRRRRLSGSCPACGYDLRATPERCPECGVAASSSSSSPPPPHAIA